jgi:hypothetical protein
VSLGATKSYGPFSVSPGSLVEVKMAGELNPGDPDLYVSFGHAPTVTDYNCRPYLLGAQERCSLDVPGGESKAYVMVRGYTAGNYNLTVTYVPGP